jgi:peptidoglycan pentaglycine glycine transferase (the first glycine)
MKSRLITYPEREIWNDFVASSPECAILQSFEWGELKARFGWKPIRLAIEEDGKIIAAISLLKKEIPYVAHSMFYAPRGPVVDFSNRNLVDFLLESIENEAEKHRAISFKMDPEIIEPKVEQSEVLSTLKKLGFVKARKQVQPRATFLLDIAPETEELLKSFEEKTRYNIRLAAKKGIVIKEEPGEKGVNIFYELYRETAIRDEFMIHPRIYYQSIREILFEKGMGTNFIAYYGDKPVAAVILFCFGERVWYMYGASASEHRNLMPNHLLHWHIIQWAKEKNFKTYDLWGIPAYPKKGHPLWGVYRFKKGFRGKMVKFIGAYDFPYSPLFYNLFENGMILWKNMHSLFRKGKIEDSLGE